MRLDWDVIRAVLAAAEAREAPGATLPADVPGFDAETVSAHMRLLIEAGYAQGGCAGGQAAPLHCLIRRLTWEGHELLARVRSEPLWRAVVRTARERGLDLSFEVVKVLAPDALRRLLEN